MTSETLNTYFEKHKDSYLSLATACTSVSEILLKIAIYGNKWTCWDWVLLFSCIIEFMAHDERSKNLYEDMIDTIDTSTELDQILTSKKILVSIVTAVNGNYRFVNYDVSHSLYVLLAHVFKKFPSLWNMSWMHAKFKDPTSKKWHKYHRLKSSMPSAQSLDSKDQYFKSKQFYNDFLNCYLR